MPAVYGSTGGRRSFPRETSWDTLEMVAGDGQTGRYLHRHSPTVCCGAPRDGETGGMARMRRPCIYGGGPRRSQGSGLIMPTKA